MSRDPEPIDHSHLHFCLGHQDLYVCECYHPEIEDLTCNQCDECEANELIAA